MTFSKTTRQFHRWVGIFFVSTVAANFVARAVVGVAPLWLTYLPLAPLAIMVVTGLCMFFQPTSQGGT
jgi:hypothetical protein